MRRFTFGRRGGRLVSVVGAALVLSLLVPSTGSAMRTLSSDVGDADPCKGVGANGGILIKRNTGGSKSETPVNVMLQCSPVLVMPFGILLADDLVARNEDIIPDSYRPFFVGGRSTGRSGLPQWLNTDGAPFVHGNIAEALRLQKFQAVDTIRNALIAAAGGFGGSIATSVIVCAVGGIPSLGITCAAAAAAVGGAAVAAVASAVGSVIRDFITTQYNRIKAMADADWFVWSDTKVIWNTFGDISDTKINPSFFDPNVNPFHTDHVRIGVQWSNVPLGQGPEYFSAKAGGSSRPLSSSSAGRKLSVARETASLNFNVGPEGRSRRGIHRVRTGTRRSDVLVGGRGNDTLQGLAGNDRLRGAARNDILDGGTEHDVLSGGAGRDTLYAGRGNDTAAGGSGHDILVGGRGRDALDGGPGPDWIFDTSGATLVRTGTSAGRGEDFVTVRDGRGDDTVVCGSRRSTAIVDAGDRVRGACGQVTRRGRILRLPG